jgi:hypothetical protein
MGYEISRKLGYKYAVQFVVLVIPYSGLAQK